MRKLLSDILWWIGRQFIGLSSWLNGKRVVVTRDVPGTTWKPKKAKHR